MLPMKRKSRMRRNAKPKTTISTSWAALDSQSADNAEKFITTRKIDSFESLAKYPEMRERLQNPLEQGEKITVESGNTIFAKRV